MATRKKKTTPPAPELSLGPEPIAHIGKAPVYAWAEGMEPQSGCFYAGMPNEVYHATTHASSTKLSRLSRSPAHTRYEKPRTQSSEMRMGSAIHAAVLEPHVFEKEWLLLADVEDRRKTEYREAAKHHNPDFILVGDEAGRVAGAQATLLADPNIGPLLRAPSMRELSGFTECPETGALCKFRMDHLITEFNGQQVFIGVDLKTTTDASPVEFSKSVANFRYHAQMAFYSDQFFWLTGEALAGWSYIVVEREAPFGAKIYVLDDEAVTYGRHLYRRDLATWHKCMTSGVWPGYDSSPEVLYLPAWAKRQHQADFALEIMEDQHEQE